MKKIITLAASVLSVVGLAAPTIVAAQDAFSAVIVTDIGGVDDKSFNQSAWEGLSAWGEEQGLEQGLDGFEYIQSNSDSDYVTNLNTAVQSNFDIIFGNGIYGRKLNAGDNVKIEWLSHHGKEGNILANTNALEL